MEHVTIQDIVECTGGRLLAGDGDMQIRHLCIDSRQVTEDCLFVPIVGEKVDAHKFIFQTLEAGAVATLTSRHETAPEKYGKKGWIQVEDTEAALHAIGALCRSRVMIPAVGVTGSVGKTTTREMIAAALSAGKKVYKTGRNYNSKIGVPITLSEMTPEDEIAVLELGMNVPGELSSISRLARLHMAVITNIGVAHIGFFGTQERICQEKLTITDGLEPGGILFLNGDDPLLFAKKDQVPFPVILYGMQAHNEYRAEEIRTVHGHTSFVMVHGEQRVPVELSVLGAHNVGNALAALAVADHNGVDLTLAAKALASFTGFQNRLQTYQNNGYTIIDDTYNASPASMKSGLTVLCDMDEPGKKIAVLGDMFELGSQAPKFHYQVGEFAARMPLDLLITVGENAKQIAAGAAAEKAAFPMQHFQDRMDAAAAVRAMVQPGDVVYLKASNGMKLKEITGYLTAPDKGVPCQNMQM